MDARQAILTGLTQSESVVDGYLKDITPQEMKLCHWVKPELVAQVRFTEWTHDGKLRHGVFLGLREDKPARDVVHEVPSKVASK